MGTLSKRTLATALRGGVFSATLVAGVLLAPSAVAGENTGSEIDNEYSVISVDDVASGNAVVVCHNSVNALGVQAADIANGLAANLPILNEAPVSTAEGNADCNASAVTVENNDDDNGDHNGDHNNGGDNGDHNGGGDDNGDNGDDNDGNNHNGGGAGNGGNGSADEHANANGNAPQPVPAEGHIAVTG